MRTQVRGQLVALVVSGLAGVSLVAAGQSHAPAPPQAETRVDNSQPVFQPSSQPSTYHEQPSYQPMTVPGERSGRSIQQNPEGTKAVPRTVVKPPANEPQCTEMPNRRRWGLRMDCILDSIKLTARKIGIIQALRIPDELTLVKGMTERPAGWTAYAFVVPGRGTLRVTLSHPNEGWFQLLMLDRWGGIAKGMLPNLVHTGKPQVSFKNPEDSVQLVFVIVDDPGWMSSEDSLYSLAIDRDWEPGKLGPKAVVPETGVWAVVDPIIKIEDAVTASVPAAPAPVPAAPKD